MGDTEGPEVDALRSALDRAREQTKEAPVDVQVKEGEQFLLWARAHLAEMNKVRATIESNIADTEARLERLKAEVVMDPVQEPVSKVARRIGTGAQSSRRSHKSPHPEFRRNRELFGGEGCQTSCRVHGAHSHQPTRCGRVVIRETFGAPRRN